MKKQYTQPQMDNLDDFAGCTCEDLMIDEGELEYVTKRMRIPAAQTKLLSPAQKKKVARIRELHLKALKIIRQANKLVEVVSDQVDEQMDRYEYHPFD